MGDGDFPELAHLPQRGDLLYKTVISLQDEDYTAFLLLFIDRIELIAIKLPHTDRIRKYSWEYGQVKKVVKADISDRSVFYLYINDQSNVCDSFEVIFIRNKERDAFAARINMLTKLYRKSSEKSSRASLTDNDLRNSQVILDSSIAKIDSSERQACEQNTDALVHTVEKKMGDLVVSSPKREEESQIDTLKSQANDIGLNMFSPDNLKRLAAVSSHETISESVPELSDGQDQTRTPTIEAVAVIDEEGNITIPIDFDVNDSSSPLVATARMSLQLKINSKALQLTNEIGDRAKRLEKLRELVMMNLSRPTDTTDSLAHSFRHKKKFWLEEFDERNWPMRKLTRLYHFILTDTPLCK